VLPNGVDLKYFNFSPEPRDEDAIVFCAKLDYFPNSEAATFLVNEVLPILRQQRPRIKLAIVGANPPPKVRALAAVGGVEVTGLVPDIRPYLTKSAVALAPLLTKAGTQFKILEAFAVGTPVVATSLAYEGLGVVPSVHLSTGDTPDQFAESVLSILSDRSRGAEMAARAREYVEQFHNWDGIADQLEAIYLHALHGSSEMQPGTEST
jgi:glycosyltransferase involved in cell wall biosynthesis